MLFQPCVWPSTRRPYSAIAPSSFPWRSSFSAVFSVAALSIATGKGGRDLLFHRIKQGGGPEGAPVQRRIPVLSDRCKMIGRRIALVPVVPVARVLGVMGH